MNNIIFEIATPADIDKLRELTKSLVEGFNQTFDPKRFEWGISRRIFDPLQRHGILIAIDEKTKDVIGMIIAELRIDPFGASEGYIKQLFLKENYRRQGIGHLLLEKALEHLKKIKVERVKVNVREDAKKAAELYQKMSFKKVYEVLELNLTDDNNRTDND